MASFIDGLRALAMPDEGNPRLRATVFVVPHDPSEPLVCLSEDQTINATGPIEIHQFRQRFNQAVDQRFETPAATGGGEGDR